MSTRNRRILWLVMLICVACYLQAKRFRWVGEIAFAMDLIEHVYVEPTNQKDLYRAAMKGMVKSLDPYSDYIEADDYKQFQRVMQQEFGGLGIRIDGPPHVEQLTIVFPIFGTPAFKAGLEPGDVILRVDGKSTEGLRVDEASSLLQGPEGTSVHLTIQRTGIEDVLEYDIVRAAIELESVVGDRRTQDQSWEYLMEDTPNIAYVRITTFGEKTVAEMKAAIAKFSNVASGLVLDLRDNSGGLLTAATEICDMFLDGGVMVTTKVRNGLVASEMLAKPGTLLSNSVPIVVLLNGDSASASEVVAACLQDRGRAQVAGERSFGKGSVQNIVEMDGGKSALKLTTARYYPPSNRNIHRSQDAKLEDVWGVHPEPELKVVLDDEQRKEVIQRWRRQSHEEIHPVQDSMPIDRQLDRAVEYLKSLLL